MCLISFEKIKKKKKQALSLDRLSVTLPQSRHKSVSYNTGLKYLLKSLTADNISKCYEI